VTIDGCTYRTTVAVMGARYSNKSWHVLSVQGAKTDETRQRRIAKALDALREGRIR
jgi:hypothetical protein